MFPKAVTEGLVVREVRGECVVYHVRDRRICRLNRTALFVWRQCDGAASIAEIAGRLAADSALPADEGLVRSALVDLRRFGLVEFSDPVEKVETRRELVVRLAKTAAVAAIMPLVVGIASPARGVETFVSQAGGPCGTQFDQPDFPQPNVPGRPSLGNHLAGGSTFVCAPGLECVNGKCCSPVGGPCTQNSDCCATAIASIDTAFIPVAGCVKGICRGLVR